MNKETHENKTDSTHKLLDGFAAQAKGTTGITRIMNAAMYSFDGFKAAYQNESAFRQLIMGNSLILCVLFFMPFSITIKMILVFASLLSIIVELFNTGIEAAIDHTSTDRHPLAKIGKDVGSAAQFMAMSTIVILWLMAFTSL